MKCATERLFFLSLSNFMLLPATISASKERSAENIQIAAATVRVSQRAPFFIFDKSRGFFYARRSHCSNEGGPLCSIAAEMRPSNIAGERKREREKRR